MRKVTIFRDETGDEGTFGTLTADNGFTCATAELPWRGNTRGRSCIPPGTYRASVQPSPKFGDVYELAGVPRRSEILIHAGNLAGDRLKGFRSDVLGCILLGTARGVLDGQKAVLGSRAALEAFEAALAGEPFELTIVDRTGPEPSEPPDRSEPS